MTRQILSFPLWGEPNSFESDFQLSEFDLNKFDKQEENFRINNLSSSGALISKIAPVLQSLSSSLVSDSSMILSLISSPFLFSFLPLSLLSLSLVFLFWFQSFIAMDNHLFRTRASNFSIASLITSDYCDDENQFSPSATSLLSNHSHFFTDKSIDNYLLDEQHRLSSLLPLTDNNTSEQYPYELTTKETLPHFNMEGKNLSTQPLISETFERVFSLQITFNQQRKRSNQRPN